MKVKEIIRVLHAYQKWRRGANIPQPDPKEIGRAIDGAIRELRNCQRLKINLQKSASHTYTMWAVYDSDRLIAIREGDREDVLPLAGIYHNPNDSELMNEYGLTCRMVRVVISDMKQCN